VSTAGNTATWKDVRCVCIPAQNLRDLADLRDRPEIRVTLAGGRAWVWWQADSDVMGEILARRIMPIEGVELFTQRGGQWYRLGDHLPAFDIPIVVESTSAPLDRIIIPAKLSAVRPEESRRKPLQIKLERDHKHAMRPATALRCSLRVLAEWVGHATSSQLSHLQGAWRGASDVEDGDAEAIVLGSPRTLPLLQEGVRYWGTDLLVPLGYRPVPELPEPALRRVVGAGPADLVVLDEDGFEVIGREAFRPLTRASVRMAQERSIGPLPGRGNRT
jgi:hypothetical protein